MNTSVIKNCFLSISVYCHDMYFYLVTLFQTGYFTHSFIQGIFFERLQSTGDRVYHMGKRPHGDE